MLRVTAARLLFVLLISAVVVPRASADGFPRFGFGSNDTPTRYNWSALHAGWYHAWGMRLTFHLDGVDFYPLVGGYNELWGEETLQSIQDAISDHPENYPDGTVWLISNEIEYDLFSTINGQPLNPPRAITADEYTQKYKKYRDWIKQINPTYRTAIGFVSTNPGHPITLMSVTAAYQARYGVKMPIDVYSLHVYAFMLPNDFQWAFVDVINDYRQIMANLGDRSKPLIVTELGVLEGNYVPSIPDSFVIDFQHQAFDWLRSATSDTTGMADDGNHLVQRWAWFALCGYSPESDTRWERTALFNYNTRQIRVLGQEYANYLQDTLDYTLNLAAGWNLISIPLSLPNPAIGNVLAPIAGKYDVVHAYDGCSQVWRSFIPGAPPGSNTLQTIDPRSGYWIHMTQAATLALSGQALSTTTITLCPGWNLISCPTSHPHTITAPLNRIAGKYSDVVTFKPSDAANPWKRFKPGVPGYANDLTQLAPGFGYWVNATAAATLVITE